MPCEARVRGGSRVVRANSTVFLCPACGTEQEKPEPCVGFNTTKGKTCFVSVFRSHNCRPQVWGDIRIRRFAHKVESNKMRLNEADREVHGFRCKLETLANAKSSMVHENNPEAACMDEMEKTERKSSLQANITPANKLLCERFTMVVYFGRPGRFRFLRSF